MNNYMAGIQVAADITNTVVSKTGQVITETQEKVGNMIDATQDFAKNTINSIKPDSIQWGPITIPFLRIRLQTQPAPQVSGARTALAVPSAVGQPAYAWMTVHVPENAGCLVLTCNNKQLCKVVDGKTHQTLGDDRG